MASAFRAECILCGCFPAFRSSRKPAMLGDPMKLKLEPVPSSEITPEGVYLGRRRLIESAGLVIASSVVGCKSRSRPVPPASTEALVPSFRGRFPPGKDDAKSAFTDIIGYNNFYE